MFYLCITIEATKLKTKLDERRAGSGHPRERPRIPSTSSRQQPPEGSKRIPWAVSKRWSSRTVSDSENATDLTTTDTVTTTDYTPHTADSSSTSITTPIITSSNGTTNSNGTTSSNGSTNRTTRVTKRTTRSTNRETSIDINRTTSTPHTLHRTNPQRIRSEDVNLSTIASSDSDSEHSSC